MPNTQAVAALFSRYVSSAQHCDCDYFGLIHELVALRNTDGDKWQPEIDRAYAMVQDEILHNDLDPTEPIKFGTSGWRGKLGKDVCVRTVGVVTSAIIEVYKEAHRHPEIQRLLGVRDFDEAKERGCVVGHDNRFAGDLLADVVVEILLRAGFKVYFASETTTGVISASVKVLKAAFSINLTPSHNPLEYGGYKYNAADAGPAAEQLTTKITENSRRILAESADSPQSYREKRGDRSRVIPFDSLAAWIELVEKNTHFHRLSLSQTMKAFSERTDCVVAIDSVHGASRIHLHRLFAGCPSERLIFLRDTPDVTFGGVAPEPSAKNMRKVLAALQERSEPFKLGAIIDPDGDRIRFTDGTVEISMNQFGAMAYHFLHEVKGLKGMVAKTVATSNLANRLAEVFGEELFEPKVGFKEFKPVIDRALVIFEESDGISTLGHTPEKDAYIGLLLALDMMLTRRQNLGKYLQEIEQQYGAFFPDRDGILVKIQGDVLLKELTRLEKYGVGAEVQVGSESKIITQVITIDGRKMVFADGSWLMIRPSGTEPKIRFYVESRTKEGTAALVDAAKMMLSEIGLL